MGWFLRQTINRKTWGLSYRFWNSGSFLTNFWLEESHLDCGHFLLLCLAEKWLTSFIPWDSPKLGTHPMVLRCFYLRVVYIYIIDFMCSNTFQPYIYIPHIYIYHIYIYHIYIYIYIYVYIYIHLGVPTGFQPPVMDHFPYENCNTIGAIPSIPSHFQTPPGIIFFVSYGKHNPMKIAITLWLWLTVCHGKSPCY